MPARRAARKADHRIRDGKRSNDALARRGSLTPRVDRAALQAWSSRGPARRGARPRPRDAAIECPPAPRAIYHPPPRATEGLARSIVGLMGLDPPVPDSSTPGRRAATVRITPPGRSTRSRATPG